ncbi:MAG: hypothetical protein ACYTDY_05750 [Planctomycetota bacterium]
MSENGSKPRQPCKYKCLRCGLIWDGTYVPKLMEELSCPSCGSNSQWRQKAKKKAAAE